MQERHESEVCAEDVLIKGLSEQIARQARWSRQYRTIASDRPLQVSTTFFNVLNSRGFYSTISHLLNQMGHVTKSCLSTEWLWELYKRNPPENIRFRYSKLVRLHGPLISALTVSVVTKSILIDLEGKGWSQGKQIKHQRRKWWLFNQTDSVPQTELLIRCSVLILRRSWGLCVHPTELNRKVGMRWSRRLRYLMKKTVQQSGCCQRYTWCCTELQK